MDLVVASLTFYDNLVSIEWKDKKTDYLSLSLLRSCCPCAFCSGEQDVFGNKYIGEKKSTSKGATSVSKYSFVGLYGVRFFWSDGHSDGIYTFKFLKELALNEKK